MDDKNDEIDSPLFLPPQPRSRRHIYIIGSILLVLIIISIGVSPLRTIIFRPISGAAPAPTATMIPGDNLFYVQETLPGMVTVDGQIVTNVLRQDIAPPINTKLFPPLRLAVGEHHVVWQRDPFQLLSCIVYVPSFALSQPCPYETSIALQTGSNAWLISFIPTLSNLSSAQQTKLDHAIQTTLDVLTSSDTVQPGEQYLRTNAAGSATPVTATQPLKARLSFHLDTDPAANRSCVPGYGDTCTYNGQNCIQICTYPFVQTSWFVVALYYPSWTYTTEQGQVLAQDQPDTNSSSVGEDHSISLQLSWNATQGWQAQDLSILPQRTQSQMNVIANSIPVCASLTGLVNTFTKYGVTSGDGNIEIQWQYYMGHDPAAGCLAVVRPADGSFAPPAYFLYRFGVLLAANSLAHSYYPSFPMADAYEQGIAQSIAASNQV